MNRQNNPHKWRPILTHWQKSKYVASGLLRRRRREQCCPSCRSKESRQVDRKGFHKLLRCVGCGLLYRFPYESPEESAQFYQSGYQQEGLTTDLPDNATLANLLATGFRGSEKDHSRIIELFDGLLVRRGARVLDFGANWGYGVWQFKQAGFDAIGYELSEPRAAYSRQLGVEVLTDWSVIEGRAPFDVVFSSHVLEHIPSTAAAIRQKLSVLSSDGLFIALFPNGSEEFQMANSAAFHRLWGLVHPVFLSEKFIRNLLPGPGLAIGTCCPKDIEGLRHWDRSAPWMGMLNTSEMLVVWASSRSAAEIA